MWITTLNPVLMRISALYGSLRIGKISGAGLLFLVLIFSGTVSLQAGTINELLSEGDSAYKDGNYQKAIELYSRVISSGYEGGELFFNLANSYYKNDNIAESILYYERAVRLIPHNKDVRYNLELARSRTVDRIEAPPRLFVWDWLDSIRDLFSPKALAMLVWLFALLMTATFAVKFVISNSTARKTLISLASVFAFLFLFSMSVLLLRISADHGDPEAIVMAEMVILYSAPDQSSVEVFSLHSGIKVTVIKELDNWYEVKLADSRQGWIPARVCAKI